MSRLHTSDKISTYGHYNRTKPLLLHRTVAFGGDFPQLLEYGIICNMLLVLCAAKKSSDFRNRIANGNFDTNVKGPV